MVTDGQKTTPAPWVPYTRAGCDVGGVGTANIELENTSTAPGGDITKVFGNPSPQATEASTDSAGGADRLRRHRRPLLAVAAERLRQRPQRRSPTCSRTSPADTPASTGCSARSTSIRRSRTAAPCVNDTNGQPVTDPVGRCGFPGFDGMLAKNSARLRRADAGERRPGHLRLHLGRARPARARARRRTPTRARRPARARSRTSSSSRTTTRRSRTSSRTSSSTGSTRATPCSSSPWTRATTSPAASAPRSRARTTSSTTTATAPS